MKKFLLPVLAVAMLAACTPGTKTPDMKDYGVLKSGEATDPVHGKQTGLFYGALGGVQGVNANGVAYIRTYADGSSAVTVNLNIEHAPKDTTYVAYLESEDGSKKILIGDVISIVGDVRHAALLETKEDTSDMRTISVYLGGELVADATLKAPAAPL